MQPSSSFYWQSDSLREDSLDGEEQVVDLGDIGLSLDDDENHDVRLTVSDGNEDIETAVENTPLVSQQDAYQYGASSSQASPRQRRKILPQSTDDGSKLKPIYQQVIEKLSIRFQVVIWYVGAVDVQLGHVPMRFRITLFWNDIPHHQRSDGNEKSPSSSWAMQGRQLARKQCLKDDNVLEAVDVPPVSILNAVSFELVGAPEVSMLHPETRLMRWTCMYNATLSQSDHLSVRHFPHDKHELKLKIGILAHRGSHSRWDKNVYALQLATEQDSQGSTSIPYGLVIDHVSVPDFTCDHDALQFEFVPLRFGLNHEPSSPTKRRDHDTYLQVTLPVRRQSAHYDTSIMPILAMLNIVAITCLPRNFSSATASTETILSIAFVQVGIRLTVDSRLPSVGYQIKMQTVLNMCFWLLCFLVLESNVVFVLVTKLGWQISTTDRIDIVAGTISFLYTIHILLFYYWDEAYLFNVDWRRGRPKQFSRI